jgi:flagellar hook-associated protein 1 FlgK
MGSITSALLSSANTLQVLSNSFDVIENNIANANTPGYARQDLNLEAMRFDPSTGLSGGVESGPLINSRSEYLEQAARNQQQFLGNAQQRSTDLGQVETLFPLSSTSGVASSLSAFFNSFSQLSVNPNDATSRQAVITAARSLSGDIRQTANGIQQISTNTAVQTTSVVSQINQLAGQIASINQQFQSNVSSEQDSGLDAQLHSSLESLSQLADFTLVKNGDGTYNVALGGQTQIVVGDQAMPLSASNNAGKVSILDSQGDDITSQITQGQLGALIQEQNSTLPGYLSSLNTFVQSLADTVNSQLSQGIDQNGMAGAPLFSYSNANDAASTLSVTNITPDQIAAASAGSPNGNGNALALAQIANQQSVGGYTFTQYYGNLAAQVGSDVQQAQQDSTLAQSQLTEAESQRTAISGVDLNAEATQLMQYQQAYQAAGKLVSVLDGLAQTIINAVQGR